MGGRTQSGYSPPNSLSNKSYIMPLIVVDKIIISAYR